MKNKIIIPSKTKKRVTVMAAFLFMPFFMKAQIDIDWQQSYGSLEGDYSYSIQKTDDGFIVLGMVDTDPPSGMYDCDGSGSYIEYRANWLFEIDGELSMVKQNCYSIGLYPKLHKTGNGLYYITELGYTSNWLFNLKIIQIDNEGNVLWTRSLGTLHGLDSCADDVFGITTTDGGVVAATLIDDASGDVIQHYGGTDCWVVKLDAEGNIVWQISLGSEGNERITCLQEAADGGLFVWLESDLSGNSNIGCNQTGDRGILVKLDEMGLIQWNLCFPRISICSMVELEDGYLLAGDYHYTTGPYENCGDGIHTYDCYLMKCDMEGNLQWEKRYGGSCIDRIVKVFRCNDGGVTVFANSKSMDGDVVSAAQLGVTGVEDGNIWIFHVNQDGDMLWERCIGSQYGLLEQVNDVLKQNDKEYILLGTNTWFDGISSGYVSCPNNALLPNSKNNIWVLHVTDVFSHVAVSEYLKEDRIDVSPNPTTGQITITGVGLKTAEVVNTFGQPMAMVQGTGETLQIDIANLPAGVYFVNVTDEEGRKCVRKVVKE